MVNFQLSYRSSLLIASLLSVVAALSLPSLPFLSGSPLTAAVAAIVLAINGPAPAEAKYMRQAKAQAALSEVDALPGSANSSLHLVRLRKQKVRDVGQVSTGGEEKSFYTARIFVGQPRQALHVTFDTSSGQVILPTDSCTSLACIEHWPYQPSKSTLAVDINADGTFTGNSETRDAITIGFSSMDLGDGSVTGQFLADAVCLPTGLDDTKPNVCAEVGLVAATHLSDMPFRAAPFDGIIGLGMQGLAISKTFSFIEMLGNLHVAEKPQPLVQQFALYHGMTFGEIAFGGHNPKRLASPLLWTPTTMKGDGYWQVGISSVRMGNRTLSICQSGQCRGILDSGTSHVGVPTEAIPEFEAALASEPLRPGGASLGCIGQDLHLDLASGFTLTLRAEDYASGDSCTSSISPVDLPESFAGVFILGEPLLKRYYTVYDWKAGAERVGFGLAAAPEPAEESAAAAAEVAEDLEEARERAFAAALLRGPLTANGMMQALLIQVMIVMGLAFLGTQFPSGRSVVVCIDSLVANQLLKLEMAKFTTRVPAAETPEGDECVICLGSCDDDPELSAGVPGLQQLEVTAVEKGQSSACCGGCSPRWRRLRCGHDFHETCIFEWFRKSKHCPTCRRSFIGEPGQNGQEQPFISVEQAVASPISSLQALWMSRYGRTQTSLA